jgi:6-phosphogluconate dehydrogenase
MFPMASLKKLSMTDRENEQLEQLLAAVESTRVVNQFAERYRKLSVKQSHLDYELNRLLSAWGEYNRTGKVPTHAKTDRELIQAYRDKFGELRD